MAILLIRHGETALNAARIVQFPDTPLSERGREQAAQLARHLASFPVRAILSSDYARARMTAEAIRDETGLAIEFRPGLRERNFGAYRGRPHDELSPEFRFDAAAPPGGESTAVFNARVDAAWAEATEFANGVEGDTAVVTHGLVCRSIVGRLVNVDDGIESHPERRTIPPTESELQQWIPASAGMTGSEPLPDPDQSRQGGNPRKTTSDGRSRVSPPAMWGNTAFAVLLPGERWRVSRLAGTRHLDAPPPG